MNVLIMTPVGRTADGAQIDYFPQRWSGRSGAYKVTTFYPFSLGYLSACLKQRTPCAVRLVDANYYGVDVDEYVELVVDLRPEVLVVEIDAIIFERQLEVFRRLRQRLPHLCIIACGPSPSAEPQRTLQHGADFVAIGEFEESITRFIAGGCRTPVPGIYPLPRAELVDIEALPLPEDEDIQRRDYCRLYGSEYREVELWATRGCPVMCNFCVVTNVYYGRANFRTRSVESVIAEIRYLQARIPQLEGIFFNEEAHNFNRRYVHALCRGLIDAGLHRELRFNCMGNYDTLDAETLELMRAAGYYKVRMGLESLEADVMKQISKSGRLKADQRKLVEVLRLCRELGIKVYATLSVGTIGASYQQDLRSLEAVRALHDEGYIQEFSLSINTPLPGTPFHARAEREGWLRAGAGFDGAYGAVLDLPGYPAADIERAFAYGTQLREAINRDNLARGVRYSSYDRDWCAPVYATTGRRPGEGLR
ncbi:B12-binding domain-containing radical SAM protein [Plasticicumulans acidivorans]|uniref:Radical SAM superfamily enzyme YgiQ (UPF0313 family) n=1 Tax=Plasticicumulans acidivorans TaxID=886464 RepID=A0A317MWQ6_9GAMM|nr:radical SAM protein [Plasticicumulans acidivorans]PWV63299.1 radical SAM superfamily enzyme YgiQ (UPF0313 family) [Plasticicumulans acidivorans]